MLRSVIWQKFTDALQVLAASIIRAMSVQFDFSPRYYYVSPN
jgi:hypothetical protein